LPISGWKRPGKRQYNFIAPMKDYQIITPTKDYQTKRILPELPRLSNLRAESRQYFPFRDAFIFRSYCKKSGDD